MLNSVKKCKSSEEYSWMNEKGDDHQIFAPSYLIHGEETLQNIIFDSWYSLKETLQNVIFDSSTYHYFWAVNGKHFYIRRIGTCCVRKMY